MALHLLKIAVGIDSVEHLEQVQKARRKRAKFNWHFTRHMPKRADEVLDGGSIFLIIKGFVQVRQRIVGLETVHLEGKEGKHCGIKLDPALVLTDYQPRRPHQGWRYLEASEAPPDRKGGKGKAKQAMPPDMVATLKGLGLL